MIFMVCLIFWYPRSNLEGFFYQTLIGPNLDFSVRYDSEFQKPFDWFEKGFLSHKRRDETSSSFHFIPLLIMIWLKNFLRKSLEREKLVSSLVALILPFLSFCVSFLFLKVCVGFTKKTFFAIFRFPFFNQAKLTVMVHFRSRVLTSDVQRLIKSIDYNIANKKCKGFHSLLSLSLLTSAVKS